MFTCSLQRFNGLIDVGTQGYSSHKRTGQILVKFNQIFGWTWIG
ncbi:Uncharacterised protein [Vibrio cholerae]|nr:Uncharacterised protein [Vibrio cholerae]CSA83348.1 Uncharacterised protein [Vibrio cholerae]